jgi:hypothetical protein
MAGVKDEHNISFLHHVERVIRKAFPQLESFMEDIKAVREAAISMSILYIVNNSLGIGSRA